MPVAVPPCVAAAVAAVPVVLVAAVAAAAVCRYKGERVDEGGMRARSSQVADVSSSLSYDEANPKDKGPYRRLLGSRSYLSHFPG